MRTNPQNPRNPIKKIPLLVIAGFFLFSSPSLGVEETPVYGDAFVTASIAEPSNLIPFLASDSASAAISRLVFNGLVKYDKNIKLTGDLAESWEVLDGGIRIRFHLRKNVLWQDGAPFTAADVEFTYQKLNDPEVPTPYGGDFQKVQSLQVIDDHTIEILYKEPFSPGLASWSMGIVPKHLLAGKALLRTEFARHPVGTGPYILKKWKSGEFMELDANPSYFEGRPRISRYILRIIPDQATTFLELQTENLDEVALTPLQYARQTDTLFFRSKYNKYKTPGYGYVYLGYNLGRPLFSDKRVRQAIGRAIQKQEIIDVTLLGLGRAATGPFLPGSGANDPGLGPEPFDPAASRRLLAEAGWEDSDGDGWLDKEGKRFSFTILTNQGNDQRKMACEMIQKRLSDIGIETKIQTVEWSTFLKEFIDKKRFDAVLLAWNLTPDPDVYDIFHSSKTGAGEFNFVSYKNEEVDRLLDQGRRLFGEEERAQVYRRVQRLIREDEPYTFLYVPESLPVIHRRFRGVELAPAGIGHNFIRWFAPENERKYRV